MPTPDTEVAAVDHKRYENDFWLFRAVWRKTNFDRVELTIRSVFDDVRCVQFLNSWRFYRYRRSLDCISITSDSIWPKVLNPSSLHINPSTMFQIHRCLMAYGRRVRFTVITIRLNKFLRQAKAYVDDRRKLYSRF